MPPSLGNMSTSETLAILQGYMMQYERTQVVFILVTVKACHLIRITVQRYDRQEIC
jgi:hypothetical protein